MSFLRSLYHKRILDSYHATPLEKIVDACLHNEPIDGRLIQQAIAIDPSYVPTTPWDLIEQWRSTLLTLLVLREKDLLQPCRHLLLERARILIRHPLWAEFQLLSLYRSLVCLLLQLPEEKFDIVQMESGACPTEWGGHWPWGALPHPLFHAEFGILLCVYTILSGDKKNVEALKRLADWQINSLDHRFAPFIGLYAHEGDASEYSLVAHHFLLFDAISRISERPDLAYIAAKQLDLLQSMPEATVSPFEVFMEAFLTHSLKSVASVSHRLPVAFQDAELALAGCRLPHSSAFATLSGGGSGMGCFHGSDVHVVNIGPQHLPLGDCRSFGLEAQSKMLKGQIKEMTISPQGFSLQGMTRMASLAKGESTSLPLFPQVSLQDIGLTVSLNMKMAAWM